MDATKDSFKRPVPILSRDNWQIWFEELKYWFIGKGLDYVIEYSLLDYAGIATPQSSPSSSSS